MRFASLLLPWALLSLLPTPAAATRWSGTNARATFSLDADLLRDHGLEIVAARRTVAADAPIALGIEAPLYAFSADASELRIETAHGRVTHISGPVLSFRGGLLLRVQDPISGAMQAPVPLLDFSVVIDPALGRNPVTIRSLDPNLPSPLEVRNAPLVLDLDHERLWLRAADLRISEAWARQLGRPEWSGQWIGGFDLQIPLSARGPRVNEEPLESSPARSGGQIIDVMLGELYDLSSLGHVGTYPTGITGLSAATTSCNNGNVDVPWVEPMGQAHPFIGLALFREMDGTLEMLGKNWIKHGWFAFANDQCDLGCVGGGGPYLAVGCSDTYSATNNGARFVLGPREEVKPYGDPPMWTACGSYFDASPTDCVRDYFAAGHDDVEHRLEVNDADLGLEGAVYRYEGCYYVASDDTLSNNIGWREATIAWTGSTWDIDDVNPLQSVPNPGPVVATWGDQTTNTYVSVDDGEAWLSVKVTDLGGGQWHYDYALYNRTAGRGIRSFSVPVGSATVTNVSFRDTDDKITNEWTSQVSVDAVTWSTDDFATDPDAPYLGFQTMYNFRFDADAPSASASSVGLLFKPGTGDEFFLDTLAPLGATSIPTLIASAPGIFLGAAEPNPFAEGTQVRFAVPAASGARLSVIDVTGRVVRVLLDGRTAPSPGTARWDGRDSAGNAVSAGVYFFRLEAGDEVRTVKTTLLR